MSLSILHGPTETAVNAATSQSGQVTALLTQFGSGNVTILNYAGATLVHTSTHGPMVADGLTPRGWKPGALIATTVNVTDATVTRRVYRSLGGTDIYQLDGTDLTPNPLVTKTGRRMQADERSTANAALTVTPPVAPTLVFALADTGITGTPALGTITNSGSVASAAWSIGAISGVTFTPSSGGAIAPGAVVNLSVTTSNTGSYGPVLTSAGATISGNPQNIVFSAPVVVPTQATLSGSVSGSTGVASSLFVTLNAPAGVGGLVFNLAASNSGVLGSSTITIPEGSSSGATTILRGTDGFSDITLTGGGSITKVGTPLRFTSSGAVSPPQAGQPQVALQAATSGTKQVTLGFPCRKGQFTGGIVATGGATQVTVRNRWPDNSAKLVEVAGSYVSTGGVPSTITLASGTATSGTALTLTDLQAALTQPVTVDAGGFGLASWSGSDWASPLLAWTTGHQMSSWIYRKQVGSDAHLVAWLEVRAYLGGAVEILPWVENGYLNVASPDIRNATYTFTMGGSQRFSATIALRHHQRTPLVSGSILSHWLGADPGVTVKHDAAYMQSTELVPTYSAAVSPSDVVVTNLPATYVPLQQGSFKFAYTPPNAGTGFDRDDMTTGGYGAPIGLLPEHDVLYLVSTADTYAAVVRNGYSAGRYQIHYRDEATNRPIRFSQHPDLVLGSGSNFASRGSSTTGTLTPTAAGGNGAVWDTAHSPSVGYMAYLLTGRWYFMEEVQFAATVNYLGNGNEAGLRNGSQGLVQPNVGAWQTRAAAWQWRTLTQALTVTPDSDTTLQSEFASSVESNIANFHGRYVAQANNPFGFIQSGTDAYDGGTSTLAPWQQDFVTAAFGWSVSMNLPIGSTPKANLSAFFAWTAQSIVGRLSAAGGSGANGYPYMNAGPYVLSISSTAVPNYGTGAGPWRADWAAVYAALPAALTSASSTTAWINSTPGTLYGEIVPGERSFWGNLFPAISYAVRHGVGGALDAWNRLALASNFSALQAAFNSYPVWSVKPASGTVPTWRAGATPLQWTAIANTSAPQYATDAYGSLVRAGTKLVTVADGGHNDANSNAAASIDLSVNAPVWTELRASSWNGSEVDVDRYADGSPPSRHTYYFSHWDEATNSIVMAGMRFAWGPNTPTGPDVDLFSLTTNQYSPRFTWPSITPWTTAGYGSAQDLLGNIWTGVGYKFNRATLSWVGKPGSGSPLNTSALNTDTGKLFGLHSGTGEDKGSGVTARLFDPLTGNQTAITFNASAAYTQFQAARPAYAWIAYCTADQRYYFADPENLMTLYVITPNAGTTWDMALLTLGGATVTGSGSVGNKALTKRFHWLPTHQCFVIQNSRSSNLHFFTLA